MQTGNEVSQRREIHDGVVLNLFTTNRADRNRYVLQALSSLLSCDDHFFQLCLRRQTEWQKGRGDN